MIAVLLAAALSLTTPEEAGSLLAADAPRPSNEEFEKTKALVEAAATSSTTNSSFWRSLRRLTVSSRSRPEAIASRTQSSTSP